MTKRVINYVSRAKREAKNVDSKKLCYYEQAALSGIDVDAEIGDCYYFGWGTEPDLKKSIQHWTVAAENGSIYAMDRLGFIYLLGRDVAVDEEKALAFLKQAFTLRYDRQDKKRYACWRNIPDRKVVFKKLRDLGMQVYNRKGNVNAQFCLGMAYYLGVGIRSDYDKKIKWLKRAGLQGDSKAKDIITNINCGHIELVASNHDKREEVEWFEMLLDEGDYKGAVYLGDLCVAEAKAYLEYKKYDSDSEKRERLIREGLLADDAKIEELFRKGFEYYKIANEHNILLSATGLAECYEKGYGVEKNPVEAEKWRKVAEKQKIF